MGSSPGVQHALQVNPLGDKKVGIIKIILRKLNMPMERKNKKISDCFLFIQPIGFPVVQIIKF